MIFLQLVSPGPSVDGPGGFLPDDPEVLIKNRKNIPMIIGANRDEGSSESKSIFGAVFGHSFDNRS